MSFEQLLNEMEVNAEPFALCELQGRCSLGLPGQSGVTLHYILAGEGEILFQDRQPIQVKTGTLVLAPTKLSHTLRSFGGTANPLPDCQPAEFDLATHLVGTQRDEDQGKLLAVCSNVSIGLRGSTGLIELVREPIFADVASQAQISSTVSRLLTELSNPRLGSRAIVRTLLLECVLILIREKLEAKDSALNWMAGLVDQRLWSSLKAMLDNPGGPHSVETLAGLAGMSRSTFAARFGKVYGTGPMELLRDIRMHVAGKLLTETKLPVKRIADQVGFKSRSAFSKGFKAVFSLSPDKFRKVHQG
ncbi:MAG: AraC family transcriptional regulator [Pseudomonadota bacterium]